MKGGGGPPASNFASELASEVPAHYRPFYLDYEQCKRLIRCLHLEHSPPHCCDSIPPSIRKKLEATHGALVLAHGSNFNSETIRALVPQLVFGEVIAQQIYKLNQFAAFQYNRVERAIRGAFKRIKELQERDEQRKKKRRQQAGEDKGFSAFSTSIVDKDNDDVSSDDGSCSKEGGQRRDSGSVSSSSTAESQEDVVLNALVVLPLNEYLDWRARMLEEIESTLAVQEAEIVHLDLYARLNFRGLGRLVRTFDMTMNTTTLPWVTANLMRELFANLDLERLLVFMSATWNKYRQTLPYNEDEVIQIDSDHRKAWIPPETFIRSTTKYWIRAENVIKVKLLILRNMPYLIFGLSDEEIEAQIDPYTSLNRKEGDTERRSKEKGDDTTPSESQLVTSIYFDNEEAYCYARRIARLEGAQLIRFRWYGSNEGEDDKSIFIERKTHHESWGGDSSTKERFTITQEQVLHYMNGHKHIIESLTSKKSKRLGQEIQDCITSLQLKPMVRTSYSRAAFQLPTSNDVRFSLDTNLCMVNERTQSGTSWCRLGEEICGKDEIVRFPYAVLEVKLRTEQPPWVSEILADVGATMVYKFSKFQHGMAFLHRSLLEHLGVPHWIPDFEKKGYIAGYSGQRRDTVGSGISLPRSAEHDTDSGALQSLPSKLSVYSPKKAVAAIEEGPEVRPFQLDSPPAAPLLSKKMGEKLTMDFHWLKPDLYRLNVEELSAKTLEWIQTPARPDRDLMEEIYAKSKNVRKIDPKSYFAAERTLLHYVQKSLYLAALAFILVAFGSHRERMLGVAFMAVSAIMLFYSYSIFAERCGRLDRRMTKALDQDKERLDSKWGPVIVFVLVTVTIIAAVILNIVDRQLPMITPISHHHHRQQSLYRGIRNAAERVASALMLIDPNKVKTFVRTTPLLSSNTLLASYLIK